MAQSKNDIQAKSDAKRGVKAHGYKLPIETIAEIARLSKASGKSQAAVITEAVALWAEAQGL